jgi:hypothetical protein
LFLADLLRRWDILMRMNGWFFISSNFYLVIGESMICQEIKLNF